MTNQSSIDFESVVPYYSQLKEILLDKINQGIWKDGDTLPTHTELCEQYGVSKAVVRQALKELEYDGKITQRRGKVASIAGPKISGHLLQNLSGTYQDMIALGYYPTTKIIQNQIIRADHKLAERMGVNPDSEVIKIERLRFVKEEPFVLITSYLPYDLCPDVVNLDLTGKSLLAELKRLYSIVLVSSKRSIEAVIASDYEAKILKIKRGSPLLLFNSTSFIEGGRPGGTTRALFRGDRARFDVEVGKIDGIE